MADLKNFAIAEVSTGYDDAATSVVLTSGGGAKLSDDRPAVWWNSTDYANPADDPNVEVVQITNISTDTLTVTRAQEGTSASTKNTGGKTYKILQGVTAALLATFEQKVIQVALTGPAGTLTAAEKFFFDFPHAGTISKFEVKANVAPTTSNANFDLQVNAVWSGALATVLSAELSLPTANYTANTTSFANATIATAGTKGAVIIAAADSGATCADAIALIHLSRT